MPGFLPYLFAILLGQCDIEQKSLLPCGDVVFYAEQPQMNFTKDEGFHLSRCSNQTECTMRIMRFVHHCFTGRGEIFMEKLLQGTFYEINQLCHRFADPSLAYAFKDMTDCSNTIWPALSQCQHDFSRNLTIATKPDGIDIPRFCCAFNDMSDCFVNSVNVPQCDPDHRKHYQDLIYNYGGEMFHYLCPGGTYRRNDSPCAGLPPPNIPSVPLTLFEAFVNIAKVLSNMPN